MPSGLTELLPNALVGICSIGFAIAYFVSEPSSRTTRMISLAFVANAIAQGSVPFTYPVPYPGIAWLCAASTGGAALAFAEWLLWVARTAQTSRRALTWISACVRFTQFMALVFLATGWAYPSELLAFFEQGVVHSQLPLILQMVFALTLGLGAASFLAGGVLLYTQDVDPAERVRAKWLALSLPFFAISISLPHTYSAIANLSGQMVFLVGAIRYHAMLGERGQFMSKFLSSQVVEHVRKKGLGFVMEPKEMEITVVCSDLRGFTQFAKTNPSQQVIQLLARYYDLVGNVVSAYGATIKDYAGDGILILVGAPLEVEDHAAQGLNIASRIVDRVQETIDEWTPRGLRLGIGCGVASGHVTVGTIGSKSRLEYTAVGTAVNLASRLCSMASDGDILVDEETAQNQSEIKLEARGQMEIKGIGQVVHFAVRRGSS